MIEPGTTAKGLLARCGITSPDEIDVIALAHLSGARTRKTGRPLTERHVRLRARGRTAT